MRTLVISDAHGCPEIIQNALDHSGFRPGRDALIYAGDLLDRGPDAEACISLAERYATEVLFGNHDLAALFNFYIYPQNPESLAFRPLFLEKALSPDRSKAWKAATCVEGVLVTHAGVSAVYEDIFVGECRSDTAMLAERLNADFRAVVAREPRLGDWYEHPLLSDYGPFWFRPWPYSQFSPLPGCVQVAGHTPPLKHLRNTGFHMIDPSSFSASNICTGMGWYRYAIVEAGAVRVEEGTLSAAADSVSDEPDSVCAQSACAGLAREESVFSSKESASALCG